MSRTQRIVSIFFLIFSAAYLVGSLSLPLGTARKPGPGILPVAIGVFLSFTSLLYFVKVFLLEKISSKDDKEKEIHSSRNFLRLMGLLFFLCFYGLFFKILGYMLSTTIFMMGVMPLLEVRKWTQILLVSILTAGFSYYFFTAVLQVNLPQGIIPF